MMLERTIPASTHGRFLVEPASRAPAAGLVVGTHGYGEGAETHLHRLTRIPFSDRYTLVSVQALHRFYRSRTREVVASWMTRQDRELAIRDNIAYVNGVVDTVVRAASLSSTALVFAGFSQGVAMAFRAACGSPLAVSAVMALGGDVPPELDAASLSRVPVALLGRGVRDEWYTEAKMAADVTRLRAAGVDVRTVVSDGAHEWTAAFSEAAGVFLQTTSTRR